MTIRCDRCGHLNSSARHRCEVCNEVLPEPWADQAENAEAPGRSELESPEASSGSAVRSRYPTYSRPRQRFQPVTPSVPAGDRRVHESAQSRGLDSRRAPARDVAVLTAGRRQPTTTQPGTLQGTIVRVDELQPEPTGANLPRILASLIVVVDLIVLLGPLMLIVIGTFVALVVVSAMFGMRWMITLFSFLMQSIFYFLSPIVGGLLRRDREPRLEPVTNYVVRAAGGQNPTFRVKGQLRGATIDRGDRVRIAGRPRHGILMFRRGQKLDTGEELTLPFNWSWLVLGLLILANVVAYVALQG